MELDFDKWEANRNKGGTIALSPGSFELVLERFKLLNQKEFTQIILGGDESYLIIGGGNGKYICTFSTIDNELSLNLVNPDITGDDEIEVVTGGQAGIFPQKVVIDSRLAIQAIYYYFNNENMDDSLLWEE